MEKKIFLYERGDTLENCRDKGSCYINNIHFQNSRGVMYDICWIHNTKGHIEMYWQVQEDVVELNTKKARIILLEKRIVKTQEELYGLRL